MASGSAASSENTIDISHEREIFQATSEAASGITKIGNQRRGTAAASALSHPWRPGYRHRRKNEKAGLNPHKRKK